MRDLDLTFSTMATQARTRTTHLRTFWPKTSLAHDLKAASFEFVGTTVFLLLAFGGVQASHDVQGSILEQTLYIATSFGLSLLVSAWFFFRATGGLFNPDVSLALLLAGCIGPMRFVLYCIAQLTGAIAAAGIVLALTPGPLSYKYVLRVLLHLPISSFRLVITILYLARSPPQTSTSLRACLSRCSSPQHFALLC
jgi:hypothetical protein